MKKYNTIASGGFYLIFSFFCFYCWRSMPIYSDEISFTGMMRQIISDGFSRPSYYPVCGGASYSVIPLLFYPAAYIYNFLSLMGSFQDIRITSLLVFILPFSAYMYVIDKNKSNDLEHFGYAFLVGSGVVLSTVAILRPEEILLLFVFSACLIFVYSENINGIVAKNSISFFFLIVYTMALLAHAKSLILFPLATLTYFYLFKENKIVQIFYILVTFLVTFQAYYINSAQFTKCHNYPAYETKLSNMSLNPSKLFTQPLDFVGDLVNNLSSTNYTDILWKMTYRRDYDLGMLPSMDGVPFTGVINLFIYILICSLMIKSILRFSYSLDVLYKQSILRDIFTIERGQYIYSVVFFVIIIFTMAINRVGAWYDKGYWILLLIVYVAMPLNGYPKFPSLYKKSLFIVGMIAYALSTYIDLYYMTPRSLTLYGGQSISLNPELIKNSDLRIVLDKCDIKGDEDKIVYENSAFFVAKKSRYSKQLSLNQDVTGLDNLTDYLIRDSSPAIIGHCSALGELQSDKFSKKGSFYKFNDYCCFKLAL